MGKAIAQRLAQAGIVVILVVACCFAMIRLAPGDPFFTSLDDASSSAEVRAAQKEHFGYDRPMPEQFVRFVSNAVRGDLGWSHSRGEPVVSALAATIPATLLLIGISLLLAFGFGILIGAWQGWRAESRLATLTDHAALVTLSVPEFVLALLALMGPALAWGLFPIGGMRTSFGPSGLGGVLDVAHHLTLPALTLAIPIMAVVARLQRVAMIGVRDSEFVRTARARGVGERRVFLRHALRNALVPALSYAGVHFSAALGGAVIIERIFTWPGMGRLVYTAVDSRDYPLVVGGVLIAAIFTVVGTMLADIALLWADPRQRRSA